MSKVKLGDHVRFVNENLSGIVTSLNENNAGVTIEDDFEIPVLVSEIVKIEGPQQNKPEQETNPIQKKQSIHKGVFIAFNRITDVLLELILHNSLSDEILFAFLEEGKTGIRLKKSGKLTLNDQVELGRYDLEQFGNWPLFHFQFLFTDHHGSQLHQPLSISKKIHSKEFHGAFRHTFFLNQQAYLFNLSETNLLSPDLEKLRNKDFSEKTPEKQAIDQKPPAVVDLHVEKLLADTSTLEPAQILSLQMDTFIRSLEMAHVHKMKQITFIHGVGNHFLKNKIRNYLSRQKQLILSYRDADMLLYGGGATEVFLS